MKFQRFRLEKSQIKQVIRIGNCQKLPQLTVDNETLQVQLPRIFTNQQSRLIVAQQKKSKLDAHIISKQSRLCCNKNFISNKKIEDGLKKTAQTKINYYVIIKMLFPEVPAMSPLTIDVMDTIFYNSDGSMTYVYTDPKRGLIKTKAKNYIQIFLKRKAQIDQNLYNKRSTQNSLDYNESNIYEQKNQYLKNYNYCALLRYKDQNFIRLKQNQFKSIFIRPVQANQKYKIFNNTLYIQLIPQQVNYNQGTIRTLQFNLQNHINTQFFKKVVQVHYQQTSYNKCGSSKQIKNLIKQQSVQTYLFFIIFQIYAYISIHYRKQIKHGFFQFMCVNNNYYLSNARKIQIFQSQQTQNQYDRSNLFEDFIQQDDKFDLEKEKRTNKLVNQIQQIFQAENQRISENVRSFIKRKFDEVQEKQDQVSSNLIFNSINDKCTHNLHYLFQNQLQYEKFLKKKQLQMDGSSPLTSLSNICRKKYKKYYNLQTQAKQKKQSNSRIKTNDKNKQNLKIFQSKIVQNYNKPKKKPSKWYKQTLGGKRQLFCE